jgi:hypothetical protein
LQLRAILIPRGHLAILGFILVVTSKKAHPLDGTSTTNNSLSQMVIIPILRNPQCVIKVSTKKVQTSTGILSLSMAQILVGGKCENIG